MDGAPELWLTLDSKRRGFSAWPGVPGGGELLGKDKRDD
jgi:hypothetical protein